MKIKAIVTAVLLLFVGISVVYVIAKEARTIPAESANAPDLRSEAATAPADATPAVAHKVVAFYFYGNYRCATCRAMEAYAEESLKTRFAEQLARGELEWRLVNMDQPENKHYVTDYALATRSLVIAEFDGSEPGRWKNLTRIWDLAGDKPAFLDYVARETGEYLAAG